MIPSITDTLRALSNPHAVFRRLGDICRDDDAVILRNSSFTEFEVTWHEQRWLLSTPTSDNVIERIEHIVNQINRCQSRHISKCILFHSELLYYDSLHNKHTGDILMQELPNGLPLDKAIFAHCVDTLIEQLNAMQAAFDRIGFTHNNLKPQNIIVTPSGKMVAIRYHHATFGTGNNEAKAFDSLRLFIEQNGIRKEQHTPLIGISKRVRDEEEPHDGMVRTSQKGRYGYTNILSGEVIPTQFDMAGDFTEGRAVVEVNGKSGLIDKRGEYIISPHYEYVDFFDSCAVALARKSGRWYAFDYCGKPLGRSSSSLEKLIATLYDKFKIMIEI